MNPQVKENYAFHVSKSSAHGSSIFSQLAYIFNEEKYITFLCNQMLPYFALL